MLAGIIQLSHSKLCHFIFFPFGYTSTILPKLLFLNLFILPRVDCSSQLITQSAITCSKLTIATLEQGVKYVQSQQYRHQNDASSVVLVSFKLTFNIFHTLFYCFYCQLWAGKCLMGRTCSQVLCLIILIAVIVFTSWILDETYWLEISRF